jgi:glycosyltransferase involved in cell wall biosynthesis
MPGEGADGAARGTVIHVIDSLGRGGAESALVAGLPALRRMGWQVHVVAIGGPEALAGDLRDRGIDVEFGKLALFHRLRGLQRQRVVVHSHLFFSNAIARLTCGLTRVPLVATLHNPDYGAEGSGRFGMRLAIDRTLMRVKRPKYIAVSEVVQSDYAETLRIDSVVCPNPVDPFWLQPATPKSEARRRLDVDDRPIVFACGRLHEQKGFDLLAQVAIQMRNVRFVIAGHGPAKDHISRFGPVEFLGPQVRTQIRDWVCASDVVAIPSRWESFGVFALEAMAVGAAIVATDIGGLRDTLGDAAWLVPAGDVTALAKAIAELLKNPARRSELGAKATARAPQFRAEIWAQRHSDIYEGLLGRSA